MRNEKGFTLLEMLLVMVVISALLLLIIPNISKQRASVQSKGCSALQKSVEVQVQAYHLEQNKFPAIEDLIKDKYISSDKCPNGQSIIIGANGEVSVQ
ncbi:competence type IV pilus major pilin ComGC [Ectobacillus ponti]|uniref:ComG operon protein 3 n=1 Tax=Ectobacillus ponti TaxID=2961894 RepID=A0AA41X594_9BACI|nr:competence type IV pilus major pilin ComGC [Ectobacillus ponti]MCP8967100.1 prepilin-type N-terminal cleavage/methylation domain-containing protein [Ectobacillus ponti]